MKRPLAMIICLICAFFFYIGYTAAEIWNYGSTDETRQADAAIILGAGVTDGEVSPVFRERINHGIQLYKNGYVDHLIFTGGVGENRTVSEAAAAGLYAISQGVPESAILLEETSAITQENIAFAGRIMEENNFSTALIVSDPLHMKRAMLLAKDCGITAYSSPTPTTRYISLKTKLPFLAREEFYYIGYKVYRLFA